MKIGMSMNKIKELTGGGASGVTPWKEHGSAKGTAQIQLPSKWTEIKIVTCNSSGLACFSSTMTYEEYQNNVSGKTYFTTFEGYNDSNFAKWCCYPKYVYLEDYHYAGDQTTSCTTTLYYKRSYENVVNVGTESNWDYLGNTTSTNKFNLPNEWEELTVNSVSGNGNVITFSITRLEVEKILTHKNPITLKSMTGNNLSAEWNVTKSYVQLINFFEGNSTVTAYVTSHVYYKKKCDNVLDVNDMGEWKLGGSVNGTNTFDLSSIDFKELFITCEFSQDTNRKYFIVIQKELLDDNICHYRLNGIAKSNTDAVSFGSSTTNVATIKATKSMVQLIQYQSRTGSSLNDYTVHKTSIYYR